MSPTQLAVTETYPNCPLDYFAIPILMICLKFIHFTEDPDTECQRVDAKAVQFRNEKDLLDLFNGLTQAVTNSPDIKSAQIYVPVFFREVPPPGKGAWDFLSLSGINKNDFWAIAPDGSAPDYMNPGSLHCSKLFFFKEVTFLLSPMDCGKKHDLLTMCYTLP